MAAQYVAKGQETSSLHSITSSARRFGGL